MTEDRKQGQDRPDTGTTGRPAATDQDPRHDKTLTEREEEKAGGTNRKTPGPIHDV